MKKVRTLSVLILLTIVMVIPLGMAAKDYATIQDGTITDVNNNVITTGYDDWGYNYQAHMFHGFYENYARPDPPVTESESGTMLIMKWSDTWLSNKDRNDDQTLDRGDSEPYLSSASEGAWLTNHQWGTYEDEGEVYHWTYFVKIVHPGDDAVKIDDIWYTEDDVEIGPAIWGAYAVIQQVYNDQGTGEHGIEYLSPAPAGFGYYNP